MYKGVDADYYGYRDDDDGTLQVLERLQEEQAKLEVLEAWKIREIETNTMDLKDAAKAKRKVEQIITDFEKPQEAEFVSHVRVPQKEDLERVVLEKRKKKLLEKYVTQNLAKLQK